MFTSSPLTMPNQSIPVMPNQPTPVQDALTSISASARVWPVTLDDITAARDRIRAFVPVSPLRPYPVLDAEVGYDIRAFVKHENFNPTNSFKVRNAFSLLTALDADERRQVLAPVEC